MAKAKHPLFDAVYEWREDGMIEVNAGGMTGRFRRNGEWVDGPLKWADGHFCQWLTQKCETTTPLRNPLIGR